MASSVSNTSTHGELRRRLAELVGSDPERYSEATGTERHKSLLASEIQAVTDVFGMEIEAAPKQQQMDAVMIRLGRDHRTGARMWDSSDLVALIGALEEATDVE